MAQRSKKNKRSKPVDDAIEKLVKLKERKTARYLEDMAKLDGVIRMLKEFPAEESVRANGKGPARSTVTITGLTTSNPSQDSSGEWQHMRIPEAISTFLLDFTEPIPFDDLMIGLQAKGVRLGDPAKPNRFQANVKTTVMNNRKRFRYDKRRDTIVLLRPQPELAEAATV